MNPATNKKQTLCPIVKEFCNYAKCLNTDKNIALLKSFLNDDKLDCKSYSKILNLISLCRDVYSVRTEHKICKNKACKTALLSKFNTENQRIIHICSEKLSKWVFLLYLNKDISLSDIKFYFSYNMYSNESRKPFLLRSLKDDNHHLSKQENVVAVFSKISESFRLRFDEFLNASTSSKSVSDEEIHNFVSSIIGWIDNPDNNEKKFNDYIFQIVFAYFGDNLAFMPSYLVQHKELFMEGNGKYGKPILLETWEKFKTYYSTLKDNKSMSDAEREHLSFILSCGLNKVFDFMTTGNNCFYTAYTVKNLSSIRDTIILNANGSADLYNYESIFCIKSPKKSITLKPKQPKVVEQQKEDPELEKYISKSISLNGVSNFVLVLKNKIGTFDETIEEFYFVVQNNIVFTKWNILLEITQDKTHVILLKLSEWAYKNFGYTKSYLYYPEDSSKEVLSPNIYYESEEYLGYTPLILPYPQQVVEEDDYYDEELNEVNNESDYSCESDVYMSPTIITPLSYISHSPVFYQGSPDYHGTPVYYVGTPTYYVGTPTFYPGTPTYYSKGMI